MLFHFGLATVNAVLTTIDIENNTISSMINNLELFGNVVLLFEVYTQGSFLMSGLTFNNNLNFALLSGNTGVDVQITGPSNIVSNSSIDNYNN